MFRHSRQHHCRPDNLEFAFTANLARIIILVFAAALTLQQLGIAIEIVNLAFGILLGTIGVAVGLAFGLDAREIAGKPPDEWLKNMKKYPACCGRKKWEMPRRLPLLLFYQLRMLQDILIVRLCE